MTKGKTHDGDGDDNKPVAFRWILSSLAMSGLSLATVLVGAFTIGGWVTSVSLGNQARDQEISAIKTDRAIRIRENEVFQRQVLQELGSLNTKADLLLGGKIK